MKLKSRHIEVFHAVMLTQSVTRAAEDLRTSQPTTSRVLGELEQQVGFALFVRDRKRMIPTTEAVMLFKEVQQCFVGMDRIEKAVKSIANFDGQSLRIAAIPSVSFGLIPLAIVRFLSRHPRARLSVDAHTYETVISRVISGQSEIGFTAYPIERLGVRAETIVTAAAVCVLPRSHPLARRQVVTAEDLRDEPFVSLEGSAPSRERIDRVFKTRGVARRQVLESQNGPTVCSLVKQGVGISVVDPFSAHAFCDPDLIVRRFEPTIPFEFNVIWRSDQPRTQLAAAFVDVMKSTIDQRANAWPILSRTGMERHQ